MDSPSRVSCGFHLIMEAVDLKLASNYKPQGDQVPESFGPAHGDLQSAFLKFSLTREINWVYDATRG